VTNNYPSKIAVKMMFRISLETKIETKADNKIRTSQEEKLVLSLGLRRLIIKDYFI